MTDTNHFSQSGPRYNATSYNAQSNNVSLNSSTDPVYDYDYDVALSTFYWWELLPPLLVYALTYIVGIVGNVLIIFAIAKYRRLKSTTNVFLASLASADLLLIFMCIPVKVARLFSFSWTLGKFSCKGIYYMQAVSAICSVLTLTAMSLERYYAINFPMKAKYVCTISKTKKMAICIWITSFILSSPILTVQVHMKVGIRYTAYWCVRDFDSVHFWRSYETYAFVLVLLLPVIVMALAYTSICITVMRMAAMRKEITGQGELENVEATHLNVCLHKRELAEDKTVKQIVRMLIVVVVLFIICWGPLLVFNLLRAYDVIPAYHPNLKHWKTAFDLLSYFNSCVNPLVYGFMSSSFRKGFKKALCSMRGKDHPQHLSMSQSCTLRNHSHRASNACLNELGNSSRSRRLEYGRKGHQLTETTRLE